MRIVELRSENFKRLKAVSIRPDGSLVQITGRNGHGKTSLLDSIYVALAGKAAAPSVPIRRGEEQATIRLDLGDIVVTRKFKAGKKNDEHGYTTSLTVENKDGATFKSPQRMLDDLLGELSFDPLAFARAKPREQIETLKRFVPDVDFEQIERDNAADYETRRDINRQAKEKRAQAEGIEAPDGPLEHIDETELVTRLESAHEHNAEIERRRSNREKLTTDADGRDERADEHEQHAADLRRQADEADRQAAELRTEAKQLRDKLAAAEALPEPVETAEIRAEIERAREHNHTVDAALRRRELEDEAEKLEAQSAELTAAMQARAEQKAQAIADSSLPIDGLTFDAETVQLAGVPFEQASDAEQLRASVAIAAALNPELRVIRIRDGSLLDEESLKLVAEMAEAQDMQVWCERVDSSGRIGFVIDDGSLKEAEQQEAVNA